MIEKYELFLFDFDGTLFNTLESSIYVFEQAYENIGVSINKKDILSYTREPISTSYKKVMGNMKGYKSFISEIDRLIHSQKVVDMAEIYDDTFEIIKLLKSNNKIIGIVTSNSKEHVLDVLEKFGLENEFDIIVGNREAPIPKPSPFPIVKALELLNYFEKDKVIYIGDSINDAIAAKSAGVNSLLLDRLNEFKQYKEYKIIDSLKEIK